MADIDRIAQIERRLNILESGLCRLVAELTDSSTQTQAQQYIDPKDAEKVVRNGNGALIWAKVDGPKGPYEKAVKTESAEWDALAEELRSNGGKMFRGSQFYWLFEQEAAIGRKVSKPKRVEA